MLHQEEAEERAVNTKNGTRSARRDGDRLPCEARQIAADGRKEIQRQKSQVAEKPFGKKAAGEQRPHVKGDMQDPHVDKGRGEQPPPLAVSGKRAEISSPANQRRACRLGNRRTRDHHREEDRYIRAQRGLE